MKHFNIPFVSRKSHVALTEKLEKDNLHLTQKLEKAEKQLAKFRAAQSGSCVPSDRCETCAHCLHRTEYYGIGGPYKIRECDLILPQCQHYVRSKEATP